MCVHVCVCARVCVRCVCARVCVHMYVCAREYTVYSFHMWSLFKDPQENSRCEQKASSSQVQV